MDAGYRPPRLASIADGVWSVIESCWQANAWARPAMAQVCLPCRALCTLCVRRDLQCMHTQLALLVGRCPRPPPS